MIVHALKRITNSADIRPFAGSLVAFISDGSLGGREVFKLNEKSLVHFGLVSKSADHGYTIDRVLTPGGFPEVKAVSSGVQMRTATVYETICVKHAVDGGKANIEFDRWGSKYADNLC